MKIRNRIGPKTLPCGTPLLTYEGDDGKWSILTLWERLDRNALIQPSRCPLITVTSEPGKQFNVRNSVKSFCEVQVNRVDTQLAF